MGGYAEQQSQGDLHPGDAVSGTSGRARPARPRGSAHPMTVAIRTLRFTSTARMANRITWMVAPEAYQKGQLTPYL